ncbi:MAG: DUF4231 domain-containing protein [Candidatus Omnitrophica bacterium]|nr:DUF4231 domain-containing protein [Candidatus Omnitrophota bacterium]
MKTHNNQEPDSGYQRLEEQIKWYDTKSMSAQSYYKKIKLVEIFCAASIPFLANVNVALTASFGVTVTLLEGLQQLNQWSQNWVTYRSTCEALRHEKYSYLGKSGVYEGKDEIESKRILSQRVEALVSTEHAKWISRQEYTDKKIKNT